MSTVWTLGHSDHPLARLIELLQTQAISAVADVRSQPFSRRHPQFCRAELSAALKTAGMAYVHLGAALGARCPDPACWRDGRVCFELVAASEPFRAGLERVIRGAAKHRVALLCAERDPLDCHRFLLVSRRLAERGVVLQHILADGSVLSQHDAESRLIAAAGLGEADLLHSRADLLEAAYAAREARI